ncbi:MAG TPA: bifunctional DNA primase/polymerase, partial [Acidimicrobiales bacterium]|nr:bifunctional DNA primase/polymerase [Acidimicrobiales bacterium]
ARLSPGAQRAHHELVAEAANPLLSAALSYVRRGWPVLPLKAGEKLPDGRLVTHGLLDATTDEAGVRAWWAASPSANVGIRTGEGIDVVDLDSEAARRALFATAPERLSGPVVVRTARGWHLWFASCGLSTRAGVLEGVDVRGRGGYVVAPPSVHPDGWRYQFLDPRTHELSTRLPGALLRPAPQWLRERLEPPPRPPARDTGPVRLTSSHYGRVALESECAAVAATPEGRRNDRLNAAAFSIGTLVGAEVLDAGEAHDHLLAAAISAGLDEREARRTIASGMRAGERQPRRLVESEPRRTPAAHGGRPPDPPSRPDERATAAVLARAHHSAHPSAPAPAPAAPRRGLGR